MKVKAMMKENNALREQMIPFNRSYFEDMILAMRASRVERVQAEELLLEAAALLLEGQSKGRNAKQIFGEDPEDYFREVMGSTPARKERSRLNYYSMIAWTALTLMFSVLAIGGLIMKWSGGSAELFSKVSVFTLIVVGLGSIVLIELLVRWMSSLSENDAPKPKTFDIKALGIYIAVAVVVIFAGVFLDNLFPVITVSPWVSLALGAAGGLGLKLIFFRS
ncbi:hypothetical protein R70723_03080 [Paenibacillus sp. FSL R7-0273]|uniref:DUF1129 family protein n=1 Tax=Paenibacillus sp. FSL R7-0273 TaxID=1536772 RepID=UPI0004F73AF5|nr:DUF1129 family protein [Paenibacillus sp. FSL R7-0273]AIQ44996.1 hypothetical protein R70723_03080 [Paenibacillus sp. FSL R7-0273]OMF88692.1 hypothetical protein BK144_21260 [Paenibacillus sp. FSL R7-0273]